MLRKKDKSDRWQK